MQTQPHSSSTITTPTGSRNRLTSKKEISRPVSCRKKPMATAPRAAPSRVMMLPAPAVQAMPMNRPLPKRVLRPVGSYRLCTTSSRGKTAAATAVWAMKRVRPAVMTKMPR